MKSTSSALTSRKIAEFCKNRFTPIFSEGEVRSLYSCLVDPLKRAEYPPYRGSGLDLQSLSVRPDIDVEQLGRLSDVPVRGVAVGGHRVSR